MTTATTTPKPLSARAMEIATEALGRATSSQSLANYAAIFEGFMERGILEADIVPRVNVLTYHAWRAKGRQVRRGEKGVTITTWIPCGGKKDPETGEVIGKAGKRPKRATVFHETQTDAIAAAAAA